MGVFTFINAWNMYMWPLLVTGSDDMRTVQIGISMLDSVDSQSITLMMCRLSVNYTDDCRCGNGNYSFNIYLYCRTETAYSRNVRRSSKRLTKKGKKNEEKNNFSDFSRNNDDGNSGRMRRKQNYRNRK